MRTLLLLLLLALVGCPGGDGTLGDDDDATAANDDDAADDDDATPTGPQPLGPETVPITTEDGLTLSGTFRGFTEAMPAVLLLHQYARDRADFDSVIDLFEDAEIATLALDFRGHGLSEGVDFDLDQLLTDPDQLRHDVLAGLDWLRDHEAVHADRVGVMGLSVGANMAVVANHNREAWGVKSTCTVSARLSAIRDLAGTTDLDLENSIYVAADLEQPQADDADALGAMTADPTVVRRVLNTSAHGFQLLLNSQGVREGTVAWFVDEL